jgi:hypothetical protein
MYLNKKGEQIKGKDQTNNNNNKANKNHQRKKERRIKDKE